MCQAGKEGRLSNRRGLLPRQRLTTSPPPSQVIFLTRITATLNSATLARLHDLRHLRQEARKTCNRKESLSHRRFTNTIKVHVPAAHYNSSTRSDNMYDRGENRDGRNMAYKRTWLTRERAAKTNDEKMQRYRRRETRDLLTGAERQDAGG